MLFEQVGQPLRFLAHYTSAGLSKVGLVSGAAISVDVYGPSGILVTAGSVIEIGSGWYSYQLTSGSVVLTGEYLAVFKSTDVACDVRHISDRAYVGRTWTANLDQAVSSRSTLTAAGIWTNPSRTLTDYGTTVTDPVTVPTVNVTGGGSTGGLLQAGNYYLKYTLINAAGETLASPESAQFTVTAGNIPRVTLPVLVAGASGMNIYLTAPDGTTNSESLYQAGISTTTTDLTAATPTGVVNMVTVTNAGTGYVTAPTISFTGGDGSGATATASVLGGLITAITITAQGSGYTAAPTVVITGGSGSGGSAIAQLVLSAQQPPTMNTTNGLINEIWTAPSRTLSEFDFAVSVGANTDKTGYKLAADGLDAIAATDPGEIDNHSTISKMLVALWRYFYKKTDANATQLKTYKDDDLTVNVTMAITNDGTTQTKGAGT